MATRWALGFFYLGALVRIVALLLALELSSALFWLAFVTLVSALTSPRFWQAAAQAQAQAYEQGRQ